MTESMRNSVGSRPVVLTIAGSDPSGGAGIQSDLRTFEALGVTGVSVVTALTAQSTLGVDDVYPVDADVLRAQLQTLLPDIRPNAIKIGMLGSAAQVDVVADVLLEMWNVEWGMGNSLVLDPVLASTGGVKLLDDAGIDVLLKRLMPMSTVITPNLMEAERLAGVPVDKAGAKLLSMGAKAVLIKGGHRAGDPVDILTTPVGTTEYRAYRIDTPHTHGAGCFLSAAIAANVALGDDLAKAIDNAKRTFTVALKTPIVPGGGRGYPYVASGRVSGRVETSSPPTIIRDRGNVDDEQIRGLYVLTDPTLRPDRSPVEVVHAALTGGARIIQMRDKLGSTPELIDLAKRLRTLCHDAGALFFVNDRVDIALAAEADGVHLGPDDMPPADARAVAGDRLLIGVSVSTVEEAKPIAEFADYLGVGAIYGSSTKLDAGAAVGTDRVREIKAAFPKHPIVAIGGIGASNIDAVIEAGADSVAVISAVVCADDMVSTTRMLAAAFDRKSNSR